MPANPKVAIDDKLFLSRVVEATVLGDFARQGHQLLVFTCHEHVWRLFQELKIVKL